MSADLLKRKAAEAALCLVEPGMKLGLGTGSTAAHFVELLAERVKGGLDVVGVPTSEMTRALAEKLGVPLTTLDETPALDMTVDGADELDGHLRLVKGGGGALLREKVVAAASRRMVVIADQAKDVAVLGAFPLPIEVVRFGLEATRRAILRAGDEVGCRGTVSVRQKDGHAFVTDTGQVILDAAFGAIPEPEALAERLSRIPGVIEHGLFIGLASDAFIAGPTGVEHRTRAAI